MNETNAPMSKIVVITGPTATGKTALGVHLAKQLNGEVVSADSMQLYKGFDIGTAKVSFLETQGVPHHMLDVACPSEDYSAARYVEEAEGCVHDILRRGKLPVIVGGTGLYIDSLIAGRGFAGGEPDKALRKELSERYDAIGGEKMLAELEKIDPARAEKLHASDKKRIVRALEVFYSTGKTISEHDLETQRRPNRFDAAIIALSFADREKLYARIDARVDKMLELGLLDEVSSLLQSGVQETATAMQAIGYKELVSFLRGEIDYGDAVEKIKRTSRRYAKRQLTWLRRNPEINWILWDGEPDFAKARQDSAVFLREHGII